VVLDAFAKQPCSLKFSCKLVASDVLFVKVASKPVAKPLQVSYTN